jgi:hypothetical protein
VKPSSRHSAGLALLACLLTLAASADDFNLVRLLLPAAFAGVPAGALPEDDENTDFTQLPRPAGADSNRVRSECPPIAAGYLLQTAGARWSAFGLPTATGRPGAAGESRLSFTPLRC